MGVMEVYKPREARHGFHKTGKVVLTCRRVNNEEGKTGDVIINGINKKGERGPILLAGCRDTKKRKFHIEGEDARKLEWLDKICTAKPDQYVEYPTDEDQKNPADVTAA